MLAVFTVENQYKNSSSSVCITSGICVKQLHCRCHLKRNHERGPFYVWIKRPLAACKGRFSWLLNQSVPIHPCDLEAGDREPPSAALLGPLSLSESLYRSDGRIIHPSVAAGTTAVASPFLRVTHILLYRSITLHSMCSCRSDRHISLDSNMDVIQIWSELHAFMNHDLSP